MSDRDSAERLEEARVRTSTMLSMAEVLGANVGPEEIRGAALVPLSAVAERFAVMLANHALGDLEGVALILAGQANDAAIAGILNVISPTKKMAPARRPRRSRPTAAERRAAADRRAADWLAGPAWEIVDPDAPDPSPDDVGP